MKAISAIKTYFGDDGPHGRDVTMAEIKALSKEERQEIGRMAAEALGEEFEPS